MCVASFNFAQKCCENESAKFDLFRTLGRDDQTFLASISILSLSRAKTLPSRVRNSSEWKFFEKGGFIFYVKWMKNAKPFFDKKIIQRLEKEEEVYQTCDCSVTRWQHYLFNFGPFTTMNIKHLAKVGGKKWPKKLNWALKKWSKFFTKFGQSGAILPNLVARTSSMWDRKTDEQTDTESRDWK